MKISDVTVTYNNRDGLIKTLNSLCEQRLSEDTDSFEIIVIDGDSNDGTKEIIESFLHRVGNHSKIFLKYISEPDQGIYDAMNKGIDMASGEWVMFINAGDALFHDTTVDEVIRNINKIDIDSAVEKFDIIYGDSVRDYGKRKEVVKPSNLSSIKRGLPFSHQAVLTRMELFKERKYDDGFRISGDYEWFLKAYLDQKRFSYVPLCISVFDTTGISSQLLYENYLEAEQIRDRYGVPDHLATRVFKRIVWYWLDRIKISSSSVEKLTGMLAKVRNRIT